MAGITKVHAAVLNPSRLHGVQLEAMPDGFQGALHLRREDPSLRFQRDLGRAIWFAFAIVVLWIGAS